jgi:predicted AAA+ superfamily ATPase
VLIEGVKGCGKTETARRRAKSEVLLDLDEQARETAKLVPRNILAGAAPRLLDEWQIVPGLWNAVRREVDARGEDGQFILTGSATPHDDETRHSGTARFSRMRMRTMTLAETGLSSRQVSLGALLRGEPVASGAAPASFDDIIEECCRGGWPADRKRSLSQARANISDYVQEITYGDIRMPNRPRRDPTRLLGLLRALAKNVASEATLVTLAQDTAASGVQLDEDTVSVYLGALERLMVYEPLTAWSPVLRSKARVRTKPKHHLADPALAAALLEAGPGELRRDLKTFGFLFESLVVRDLRVYAAVADAQTHHYRDNTGMEVDVIVTAGFKRWAAFEVKLGTTGDVLDKAAANLLSFAAKVDVQSSGTPQILGIVTSGGCSYTRPDGVAVIPLATLDK